MIFQFCISKMPVTLKEGQGHQSCYKWIDLYNGHNYAMFKTAH